MKKCLRYNFINRFDFALAFWEYSKILTRKLCHTLGRPRMTQLLKCNAPDAFSGAKFQVFLENDFFWEVALVLQSSKFVKNFQMCPNQNGMNNFEIAEYVLEIISVRPKPNIRPKFSAKLAEIFCRNFRPTCRTFGQVKNVKIGAKFNLFQLISITNGLC